MDRVGPKEIHRILAVTDALQIHRESVTVPLATRGDGALRVTEAARVEIIAPAQADFDSWLAQLPDALRALDLSSVRKAD